jgi:CBS-domain-containing membrane protein
MRSGQAPDGSILNGGELISELELTDEDVLDAMRQIPGYLDISTEDFRAIYHLAHGHALGRIFERIRPGDLMLTGVVPVRRETRLRAAAEQLVAQGRKSLPVVDEQLTVIGILTETDVLRCLGAASVLDLLLSQTRGADTPRDIGTRCDHATVAAIMSAPAVTVQEQARFDAVLQAFRRHQGRSMPVIDTDGRLRGLLLRKDFLHAFHQEDLL